jgi:hypothetical protein
MKQAPKEPLMSITNISEDTSDTDDTGCLSRTTDSFSDDSTASAKSETGPRRIVVRSRSMGRMKKNDKKYANSKSLSPARSRKLHSFITKSETTSQSGRARDIRIRRIQRLKGYVPLDDKPISQPPAEPSSPNVLSLKLNDLEAAEALTPKRKTYLVSPDEKKEEDPTVGFESGGNKNDLILPNLILPEMEERENNKILVESDDDDVYIEGPSSMDDSSDYDSMLDHLDLQLIDLQRPIGVEYGDDEKSV